MALQSKWRIQFRSEQPEGGPLIKEFLDAKTGSEFNKYLKFSLKKKLDLSRSTKTLRFSNFKLIKIIFEGEYLKQMRRHPKIKSINIQIMNGLFYGCPFRVCNFISMSKLKDMLIKTCPFASFPVSWEISKYLKDCS